MEEEDIKDMVTGLEGGKMYFLEVSTPKIMMDISSTLNEAVDTYNHGKLLKDKLIIMTFVKGDLNFVSIPDGYDLVKKDRG